MKGRRIIIGEADEINRRQLKDILTRAGFLVLGEASDGITALKLVRSIQPDVVLLDMALQGMNGVEVGKIIEENKIAPVILLGEYKDKTIFDRLKESWLFSYVFKPFQDVNLVLTIEMAITQYEKFLKLEKEIDRLKNDLETRKVVDRAKALLIKHKGLDEDEAFKFIQKQSMNKRVSKKAVAEAIILAYDF